MCLYFYNISELELDSVNQIDVEEWGVLFR